MPIWRKAIEKHAQAKKYQKESKRNNNDDIVRTLGKVS